MIRKTLLRGAGAVVLVLALWLVWEAVTWPDVTAVRQSNPATTAFIERYRERQRERGEPDRVARTWRNYAEIAPAMKKAVLVAEDINFFSHDGFDTFEMRAAIEDAIRERRAPRGASTITQQLARNLWLSPSRNPLRKLKEALLTMQLERTLSKQRILELYLNVAELGPGVYGVEAAAQRYFHKSARWLTAGEAARIAAALPGPGRLNPDAIGPDHWRVRTIRRRMQRASFLDAQI